VKPPRASSVLLAILCLAASAGLAACGNKVEVRTDAETEGPYVSVGPLKYQVQISRLLNPHDTEDRPYLEGVAPDEGRLRPGEIWFGVFIRALNETHRGHPSARQFEIEDTQGHVFEPVPVTNAFAYRPAVVPPEGSLPQLSSIADEGPIEGSLVLFKIPYQALGNRPLELRIADPRAPHRHAVVELDV
jgi:hypothetical protein